MAKRNRKVPGIDRNLYGGYCLHVALFSSLSQHQWILTAVCARRLPPPPENEDQKKMILLLRKETFFRLN